MMLSRETAATTNASLTLNAAWWLQRRSESLRLQHTVTQLLLRRQRRNERRCAQLIQMQCLVLRRSRLLLLLLLLVQLLITVGQLSVLQRHIITVDRLLLWLLFRWRHETCRFVQR